MIMKSNIRYKYSMFLLICLIYTLLFSISTFAAAKKTDSKTAASAKTTAQTDSIKREDIVPPTSTLRKDIKIVKNKDGSYSGVTPDGTVLKKCYFIVRGRLYRARPGGKLFTDIVAGDFTFDSKGRAKEDVNCKLKIEIMQLVAKITKGKKTQEQKLRACFDYVVSKRFKYKHVKTGSSKRWMYQAAYDMLKRGYGDCYCYSALFSVMAKELGYDPELIRGLAAPPEKLGYRRGAWKHCWVKIGKYYYDPERHSRNWMNGWKQKKYKYTRAVYKRSYMNVNW